jgi:metal-sulfur cluster biosynthetic enzyme
MIPVPAITDKHFTEKTRAIELLFGVMDPELFVNVVDLGLIYAVDFDEEENKITVTMTLSTPHCPMGESIMNGVKYVLEEEFTEKEVNVDLVWEPAWNMEMVSEAGKEQLGM